MPRDYPELNVALMKKLYEEFGGLYAYYVEYLDSVTFKLVTLQASFNEASVDAEVARLRATGFQAVKKMMLVKFDGAYAGEAKTG